MADECIDHTLQSVHDVIRQLDVVGHGVFQIVHKSVIVYGAQESCETLVDLFVAARCVFRPIIELVDEFRDQLSS